MFTQCKYTSSHVSLQDPCFLLPAHSFGTLVRHAFLETRHSDSFHHPCADERMCKAAGKPDTGRRAARSRLFRTGAVQRRIQEPCFISRLHRVSTSGRFNSDKERIDARTVFRSNQDPRSITHRLSAVYRKGPQRPGTP